MNKSFLKFFSVLFIIYVFPLLASASDKNGLHVKDTMIIELQAIDTDSLPNKKFVVSDNPNKKRFVSALFAFPFPFGFMGAHRVMLGTKPWIPVVYVATFGGCFGLLPLIDFCVITFSKDLEQYENNPRLFMWVK